MTSIAHDFTLLENVPLPMLLDDVVWLFHRKQSHLKFPMNISITIQMNNREMFLDWYWNKKVYSA